MAAGSSPLTRGAPDIVLGEGVIIGLIPAYAGRTTTHTRRVTACWAHPRLRGAHNFSSLEAFFKAGSSPLTRGALWLCVPLGKRDRLIPAYAGRTRRALTDRCGHRAHPRLRGAHDYFDLQVDELEGSSPLTRGALQPGQGVPLVLGLIPAYAGRTLKCNGLSINTGAHPRLRGAHDMLGVVERPAGGSSPLTRGAL